MQKRIYGRVCSQDIFDSLGQVIIKKNTLILNKEIDLIESHNIKSVSIRSVLDCKLFPVVCQNCYGLDLGKKDEIISLGTAVGVVAAQSLGEPGTQLTMRTFHSGGVAGKQEDIVQGLPKVKALFDNVSFDKDKRAVLSRISGNILSLKFDESSQQTIVIQRNNDKEESYFIPSSKMIKVEEGQFINIGEPITSGNVELNEHLEISGRYQCQEYIKKQIWKVYHSQGVEINEKHIELFTRQMLSKVEITSEVEDSKYLIGDLVNYIEIVQFNKQLQSEGKKQIEFKPVLLGIKKVINSFDSFLSAISFQNTSKLLLEYALFKPVDLLQGIKENMIAGQLIPVGTGFKEREKWPSVL